MLRRGVGDEFERALEAFNQADFAAAIGILNELASREPASGEIWLQLGICYLKNRQPGQAAEALARAVSAEPQRASTHFFLGAAYGAAGDLERASGCLRRALEIDPCLSHADRYLLQVESLLESRERYLAGCRLLYSSQPTVGDLNRALRELVESAAIYEGSPARDNLRECARKLIGFKQEYSVNADLTPELENWFAACRRGHACWESKNWAGACDAYLEALRARRDAFVYHAVGFCFVELGAMAGAVRAWLRALEIEPEYDFSRFGQLPPPA
jgi:tetratricopeptide (TPR) repeat protein